MLGKINTWLTVPLRGQPGHSPSPGLASSAHRLHFIRLTETLRPLSSRRPGLLLFSLSSLLLPLPLRLHPSQHLCPSLLLSSFHDLSFLIYSFSPKLPLLSASAIFALSPLVYFHLFNIFSDSPTWLPSFIFFLYRCCRLLRPCFYT